jgi:ABC-2 type transport system permease protein
MNITPFKTLVLREYWENRSFVWAPVIIAAVVLFSLSVGLITAQSMIVGFGDELKFDVSFSRLSQANLSELEHAAKAFQYGAFLSPIAIGLIFVLIFYVLGSLYNERRDRSILFWKSMPVSDTQTVLSKVFTALFVAPALAAIVAVISQLAGLFLLTLLVWFNNGSAWDLIWSNSALFNVILNDFGLLLLIALWLMPILGWLWLVSAYAKRAAFLIALFVPMGIILVEGLIFGSAEFAGVVARQFAALEPIIESTIEKGHPFNALLEMRLWLGIGFSALCIGLAIYIRRYRDDSY